jgi:hypothetical protein
MFTNFAAARQSSIEPVADNLAVGQEHLRKCHERRSSHLSEPERNRHLGEFIQNPGS